MAWKELYNQKTEFNQLRNCWKIQLGVKSKKTPYEVNYKEGITRQWKNGMPWYFEKVEMLKGKYRSVYELVTPEWERKYGKIEKE